MPLVPSQRSHRLDRTTSSEQVAAHIRRLILSGDLTTGDRINQADLADDLGVSRIPVREALVILDREGWITIESNRGAYVAGLAAADIGDHYELRGLVFGLIGRRATEKATEADVAALAEVQTQMASADTLDDFAAANGHFIATLVRTARSPRLAAALQVSPPIMTEGFFEFVPSGRAVQMAGVDAFMASLIARSADEADVALQSMLDEHGRAVVAVFVERGLATA